MGKRQREYATATRSVEALAILAFAVLAFGGGLRMISAAADIGWISFGLILAAALLGWMATDFLSGLVHWAFDTYGSVRTPFVGPWLIRPFREHHDEPRAMGRHDFIETNGSSAMAALPLLALALVVPVDGSAWMLAQAFLLFLALGGLAANQCHKWAHLREAEVGPAVRLAQSLGLVLSPQAHRRHHARPHDSYYCTASGWMNGVLEAVGFFRGVERMVALVAPRDAARAID